MATLKATVNRKRDTCNFSLVINPCDQLSNFAMLIFFLMLTFVLYLKSLKTAVYFWDLEGSCCFLVLSTSFLPFSEGYNLVLYFHSIYVPISCYTPIWALGSWFFVRVEGHSLALNMGHLVTALSLYYWARLNGSWFIVSVLDVNIFSDLKLVSSLVKLQYLVVQGIVSINISCDSKINCYSWRIHLWL